MVTSTSNKRIRSSYHKRILEWLIDALSFSKADFKIIAIGGKVLNSEKVF